MIVAGSCVQALYDFPKNEEEDLGLAAGDVVKVTDVLNNDWLVGVSTSGSGQFPASFVDIVFETMPASVGISVADFLDGEDGDLAFKRGEVIGIIEEIDENWLNGCTKTSTGIFPRSFVETVTFQETKGKVQSPSSPNGHIEAVAYGMSNEAFNAQSSEELSFPKGVRIDLVKEIDAFWTLGIYKGTKGKFPSMFVTVVRELPQELKHLEETEPKVVQSDDELNPKAKALFMYVGTSEQDLSFDKGDIVLLKERVNEEWLKGQIGNSIGIFPASYVKILIDLPQKAMHSKKEVSSDGYSAKTTQKQNGFANGHLPTSTTRPVKKRPPPTIVKTKTNKDPVSVQPKAATSAVAMEPKTKPIPLKPRLAPKPPAPVTRSRPSNTLPLQNDCITVIKPLSKKDGKSTKSRPAPIPKPRSSPTEKVIPVNVDKSKSVTPLSGGEQVSKVSTNNQGTAATLITHSENNNVGLKEMTKKPQSVTVKKPAPPIPTNSKVSSPLQSPTITTSPSATSPTVTINPNDLLSVGVTPGSRLPKPLAPQPPVKSSSIPEKLLLPQLPHSTSDNSMETSNSLQKKQTEVKNENVHHLTTEKPERRKAFTPPPERKVRPKSSYFLQEEQTLTLKKSHTLTRRNTSRGSLRATSKLYHEMTVGTKADTDKDEFGLTSIEIKITDLQAKIGAEANLLSGVETFLEVVTDKDKVDTLRVQQAEHLAVIKELNEDLSDLEDEKSYILAQYGKVEDIENRIVRVEQQIQMFKTKVEQLENTSDITTFEDLAKVREDKEFCRSMVDTLQEELVTLREKLAENQKQFSSPEETRAKQLEQRAKVVEELIRTERDYVRDISLCSAQVLSTLKNLQVVTIDCDTLFGNMRDVAAVSNKLLQALEFAVAKPVDEIGSALGHCFIDLTTEMKSCYAVYCKNYDDAQFLSEKYEQDPVARDQIMNAMKLIRGFNPTWDLPSYLIKPVQRILKYPLLLQEFLKNSPENDQSRPDTALAINAMTDVATSINEFKRRKDLVQKYQKTEGFGDKISRLNWHSVLKKSSRINQRLTQFTGINPRTVDLTFNEEEKKVRTLEKLVKTLIKNVSVYIEGSQELAALHKLNTGNIYEFCEDLSPPDQVKQYIFVSQNLVDVFNKHVHYMQTNVLEPLNNLLQIFPSPFRLMEKRADKLLDYDSLQKKAYRTKDKDKLKQVNDDLSKAKNNYQALNSQLLEDLPKLCVKCTKYVILCLANFIQTHRLHSKNVRQSLGSLPQAVIANNSSVVLTMHAEAIRLASEQLSKLTFTPDRSITLADNRKSLHLDLSQNATASLGRTNFYVGFSALDTSTDDPTAPIKPSPENVMEKELLEFDERHVVPMTVDEPKEKTSDLDSPGSGRTVSCIPNLFKKRSGSDKQIEINTSWYIAEDENLNDITVRDDLYIVKYTFDAEDKAEISVNEGEVVRVITKCDTSGNTEWWLVESETRKGYMPSNYLEPTTRTSKTFGKKDNCASPSKSQDVNSAFDNPTTPTSPTRVTGTKIEETHDTETIESSNHNVLENITKTDTGLEQEVAEIPGRNNQVAEFYVADYDFEKSNTGELDLVEGQLVHVITKHDCQGNTEWWLIEVDGISGYVPGNYLSFVHAVQLG